MFDYWCGTGMTEHPMLCSWYCTKRDTGNSLQSGNINTISFAVNPGGRSSKSGCKQASWGGPVTRASDLFFDELCTRQDAWSVLMRERVSQDILNHISKIQKAMIVFKLGRLQHLAVLASKCASHGTRILEVYVFLIIHCYPIVIWCI